MSGRTTGFWVALVLVAVAVAVWPYHAIVDQLPWGADASRWVAEGSLDNPDWWDWATGHRHFVGYRPVTALTFVFDQALFGYSALGYRLTDLTLHAASGVLVGVLWVALTGVRGPAAFVPVLVLLGHPATEEVVPYVARRSYLLATDFGSLGLLLLLRAARSGRWVTAVGAAVSLGVAVLANEVAYVLLPLFVGVAWWSGSNLRSRLRLMGPALVVCGVALLVRYAVLGTWSGGYERRYFALVVQGMPMWTEMITWQPARIAEACWSYLLLPTSPSGAPALVPAPAQPVALAVFGGWLVWTGLVGPIVRWRTGRETAPLLASAWLVGATAIVVLSQTWFWRQAYTLLVPLGLLAGLGLDRAARDVADRRATGVVSLLCAGALLASVVYTGPVVHGMDEGALERQVEGNTQALRVRDAIADLEGPATVWLIAPSPTTTAHLVRLWGDRFGASRAISFRLLGSLTAGAVPEQADVSLVDVDGRAYLSLDAGLLLTVSLGGVPKQGPLPLDRLYRPARHDWILALDAADVILVPVPAPPVGLPVLPPPTLDVPDIEPALPPDP